MVGRLRLWSGYVLFFYVVTHLLNHTLGLISLRVLEVGRHWFVLIWHNPIGQTALYGALFTHFFLALWSLYRRRALNRESDMRGVTVTLARDNTAALLPPVLQRVKPQLG